MRVGTICFSTSQGIAHLAKDFYDEGIITDPVVIRHGAKGRLDHPEWFAGHPFIAARPSPNVSEIRRMIQSVEALLFFETPFNWEILNYAHSVGVRTYIVPMYECTPRHIPCQPTRWLCPSLLDCEYFPGNPFVPIPIPRAIKWQQRTKALRFLHNGGNLGLRGHKGTLEILQAMQYVKSPIQMEIRAQDVDGLGRIATQSGIKCKDDPDGPRVSIWYGDYSRNDLFTEHDVFIMAEKYNGLSLPLAEARASGMLVITSDRHPMNKWLPSEYLIPVHSYSRQAISGAYMEYQEANVRPQDIAAKIDEVYGTDITQYSLAGKQWAEEMSWDVLKPKWQEVLSC